MIKQDQNQGGKRRRTCATDQMLPKTIPPVITIALCVLLSLVVSGCSGTTQAQATATVASVATSDPTQAQATATVTSVATSEPTSVARQPLPTLERPASFTDKQWLGKQMFFDPNLSSPPGQACMGCHD